MKMTENRQQLADAIANVKAAAEAEAVVRDHHNKIAAIAERETELRGQLEAAQREHDGLAPLCVPALHGPPRAQWAPFS